MIEHHWLQDPGAPCNPNVDGPCQPYLFNQGFKSIPMTLFYDGHVRHLSVREAVASDSRVTQQTFTDGLWHRGTPFRANGYQIGNGFDFLADTSYHILTTGGILGRDTIE